MPLPMREPPEPSARPSQAAPIAIGGLGGSGTRVVAQIVRELGVDIGPDLNGANDNLWFTLLFVRPRWLAKQLRSGSGRLGTGLGLFKAAMNGALGPSPAQAGYLAAATADVARHGYNYRGNGRGGWAFTRARSVLREGRRSRPMGPWGWKEPATYLLVEHLAAHLDDVRYVHVVRHGLDVAFGRNQQHLGAFGPLFGIDPGELEPQDALRYWLAANERTVEAGRRLLGDRFVQIRYDDLCLEPRTTIERLLSDLGEEIAPAELDRLSELPSPPASLGMHAREDLSDLDPADVERVRELGFGVGRVSARSRRPAGGRKRPLRLSVALCTFNGARYLPQQLESIAAQTRLPDELVVCDDGSTDATRELLTEFAEAAPFPVRVHEPGPAPLGPGRNFGRAIDASKGPVIALCDQDDVWAPDRLARIESAFTAEPDLSLFFTDADLIDEQSRSRQLRLWEALGITPAMHRQFVAGDPATRVGMLCNGNMVTGATLALRADARDLVLPVPEGWIHDAWIGVLLSATAKVRMSRERTIRYRLHEGQQVGIGLGMLTRGQLARRNAQLVRRMTKRERPAFRDLARGLEEAAQRLVERSERWPVSEEVLRVLSERAAHFAARGRMDSLPRRWSLIRSELSAGRYHRYSNGWPSVAKDLLLLDRFGRR